MGHREAVVFVRGNKRRPRRGEQQGPPLLRLLEDRSRRLCGAAPSSSAARHQTGTRKMTPKTKQKPHKPPISRLTHPDRPTIQNPSGMWDIRIEVDEEEGRGRAPGRGWGVGGQKGAEKKRREIIVFQVEKDMARHPLLLY
ncbi:hypothetical protein B296_00048585 [Ensete ventricosum]|uniref:Uncharacterized protein n=1 Tax=Ensete ventricosum TaxID=4639 RepID=A0A426YU30_ENSVE|nr:hypothetical protein B296_00048585 [Ensete ventricosum]